MSECYVYMIECRNGSRKRFVKIGMTDSPQERIDTLQTGNPYELRMMACIPCKDRVEARHLESFLHKKLHVARVRGEWFRCKGDNLNKILVEIASMKGVSDWHDATQDDDLNSTYRKEVRKLGRELKRQQKLRKEESEAHSKVKEKMKETIKALKVELVNLGLSGSELGRIEKSVSMKVKEKLEK